MPLQSPCPSDSSDHPPAPAALRALLATTARDPWLASLFLRRLDALRERLGELRAWLASLSRQVRRATARRWALALPAAVLTLALAIGPAQANTITVDIGAGGNCSLVEAIGNANDTTTGQPNADCGDGDETGADTIQFAVANATYLLDSNYGAALPDIMSEVTIQGNGNTTLDAQGMFIVLRVTGAGSLALANARITGGSGSLGGGIYANSSTLSVTNATISGNSATARGAGIFVGSGSLSVTSATISGNSAVIGGGGIYVGNGTANVTNATISGNSAGVGGGIYSSSSTVSLTSAAINGNSANVDGGGIFAAFSTVSLTNATISGNSAGDDGGGIASYAFSSVSLTHATVTGNSAASYGGGIAIDDSGAVESQSSIVAGQVAGGDCSGVPVGSNGYNIESGTVCGFTGTGDQQNVTAAQLNLDPLALNAPGNTQTHALGAGSFALNQIPPGTNGCGTTITSDQRGVARPQEGACEVGAYEFVPTPTPAPPTAAQVTQFTAAPDPTGRIRVTWETASEVDVVGFRVERAPSAGGPWRAMGGLIPARGSTAGGSTYTVTDAPGVGRFAYRLEVVGGRERPQTFGPVVAVVRALRAFLPVGWR